ncbi:hypothetical protein V2J09_005645 [Rumex salicifolius]
MGFGMASSLISAAKKALRHDSLDNKSRYHRLPSPVNKKHQAGGAVPRRHVAVNVGDGDVNDHKVRYVIPISYLNHRLFDDLLSRAEEEDGFSQPKIGCLTFPCTEDLFLHLASQVYEEKLPSSQHPSRTKKQEIKALEEANFGLATLLAEDSHESTEHQDAQI